MITRDIFPVSPPSDNDPVFIATTPNMKRAHNLISDDLAPTLHEIPGKIQGAFRRSKSPPRNSNGQIVCDHVNCQGKNQTFKRLCEWNKHMDRHERPYKCREVGCELNPGFTYSGGLLRHQREVHKMHLSTKQPLFCPFPNCNRSSGKSTASFLCLSSPSAARPRSRMETSPTGIPFPTLVNGKFRVSCAASNVPLGTGFTRKENLEEHKRRRHLEELSDHSPVNQIAQPAAIVATPTIPTQEPQLKRRRISTPADVQLQPSGSNMMLPPVDGGLGIADNQLIQHLREEVRQKDEYIRRQAVEIQRLQSMLRALPQQAIYHMQATQGRMPGSGVG
jgi:hypothetical protein